MHLHLLSLKSSFTLTLYNNRRDDVIGQLIVKWRQEFDWGGNHTHTHTTTMPSHIYASSSGAPLIRKTRWISHSRVKGVKNFRTLMNAPSLRGRIKFMIVPYSAMTFRGNWYSWYHPIHMNLPTMELVSHE